MRSALRIRATDLESREVPQLLQRGLETQGLPHHDVLQGLRTNSIEWTIEGTALFQRPQRSSGSIACTMKEVAAQESFGLRETMHAPVSNLDLGFRSDCYCGNTFRCNIAHP